MNIFSSHSYIDPSAAVNYAAEMKLNHPKHMTMPDSPYFGNGAKSIHLQKTVGAEGITRAGSFEHAMLQALDKVSGTQQYSSELAKEALINPDSVDIHDVTMAQAKADMALGITRNILSRLVQGWRDLINTR